MASEIKSPVETTQKINTYLQHLIDDLKTSTLALSLKDKIDVGCLLDSIRKQAEEYVKELKKDLPLSLENKTIVGSIGKASYSERINLEIAPEVYEQEVKHEDFMRSIKVNLTNAKTFVPETRLKEIGTATITPVVSFSLR